MLIDQILKYSKALSYNRTLANVALKVTEELGEVVSELNKSIYSGYKEGGSQKEIIEECSDTLIALIDLMYQVNPNITEQNLKDIVQAKLDKWYTKYKNNEIQEESKFTYCVSIIEYDDYCGLRNGLQFFGSIQKAVDYAKFKQEEFIENLGINCEESDIDIITGEGEFMAGNPYDSTELMIKIQKVKSH